MLIQQEGLRLTEPEHVRDVFVSGMAEAESIGGGCVRFTYYCRETINGVEQDVVVARLIVPVEAVHRAIGLAAKAVGVAGIALQLSELH